MPEDTEQPDTGADPAPIIIPKIDVFGEAAAHLADTRPEVQEHVIEQHRSEQAAASPVETGTAFNPSIHATGADGGPVINADGSFRKRRGVGKSSPQSRVGGKKNSAGDSAAAAAKAAATAAGTALAQLTFVSGVIIGGEEWAPRKDASSGLDEAAMMTDAYAQYCAAKGITDIPPGWALTVALLAYAGPRFAMPHTQSRMAKVKAWTVGKIGSWKVRRAQRRAAKAGAV